jgi:hypothetical protein
MSAARLTAKLNEQAQEHGLNGYQVDDGSDDLVQEQASAVLELFQKCPRAVVSAEQLEGAGLELLKAELGRLGLKAGGSLQERASRLFSTKGLPAAEWAREIFAKRKRGGGGALANKKRPIGAAMPPQLPARVAAPRGQGAAAHETVGIWRPNT